MAKSRRSRVPFDAIAEARLVLTDELIRDALRRTTGRARKPTKRRGEAADAAEEDETEQEVDSAAGPRVRGEAGERQWQSAPTGSNFCRSPTRSRARSRSTADRHRGDGGCDPEGGALALRRGDRHPRRDRPEDRRDALHAPAGGGRDRSRTTRRRSRVDEARERNPDAQVGDFIAEPLPPFDFGRIAAQSAKQVIVQKVREAERDRQYDEYKDRIGEIVNGTVKRVEYGNVIVDLGRGEGIIRRDEMIPRETFRSATASAPMSTTCAASSAARRSSCRAPIRSSWRSSSRRKCRRSMTASSRSSRSPAIRARAPRSP